MPKPLFAVVLLVVLLAAVALAVALRGQRVPEAPGEPATHPLPAPPPPVVTAAPATFPAPAPALVAGIQPEVLQRFRQEAAAGDAAGQDNLASCYEQGLGVAADPAQAVLWY